MEEDRTEHTPEEQSTQEELQPASAEEPRVAPPAEDGPPARRRIGPFSRWGCLVAALVFVMLPLLVILAAVIVGALEGARPRLALIHVEGIITAGRGAGGLFAPPEAGSERIVRLLRQARMDDSVEGVILRINSPGGSAAGSQEIYSEIRRVREAGKPVYASMGDVAASGGYYVAAITDKIFADPATATGSIGVIWSTVHFAELLDRLGIDFEVIKSGPFKDLGGPHRSLTPEEREIIQGMIDDIYEQFVEAVSEGRQMPIETVRELANGRVFTGRQAKELELVDELGGLRETISALGIVTGLGDEPRVEAYDRVTWFDQLFRSEMFGWRGLFGRMPGMSRVPTLE